jgi:hypothetical protein
MRATGNNHAFAFRESAWCGESNLDLGMGLPMLIRILMISIFLASAFFRPAEAYFVTGNDLLKHCSSTDKDTAEAQPVFRSSANARSHSRMP